MPTHAHNIHTKLKTTLVEQTWQWELILSMSFFILNESSLKPSYINKTSNQQSITDFNYKPINHTQVSLESSNVFGIQA